MLSSMTRARLLSALFGASLLTLGLAACGPDDNNGNNTTTQPPRDMGGTSNDMGGTSNDMGGTSNDMGGTSNDMGGTSNDMGTMPVDMGGSTPNLDTAASAVAVFNTELATAICKGVWECPEKADVFLLLAGSASSQEACVELLAESGFASEGDIGASVAAGRATYDKAKAETCYNATKTLFDGFADGCAVFDLFNAEDSTLDPSCDEFLVGTVAENGACLNDDECSGELYCEFGEDNCYGTCVAEVVPCDDACTDAQYCDFDTDACLDRKPINSDCFDDEECQDGLMCSPDDEVCVTATPTTVTLGEMGAPCTFGFPPTQWCKVGLACTGLDFTDGGIEGTCGVPLAAGQDCFLSYECAAGLICNGEGVCAEPAADGAVCGSSDECSSGYCNSTTEKCEAVAACMLP